VSRFERRAFQFRNHATETESATRACQSAREVRRRIIELINPLTRFFICK
jgi:hypothetical protein